MRASWSCAIVLALAGCSAITSPTNRDVSFSGAPGRAYLLVVAAPRETVDFSRFSGLETFVFERVDLASAKFLRDYVFVSYDDSSKPKDGPHDEFLKPESMAASRRRFAGRSVATGEYALVEHATRSSLTVHTDCYTLGSPVYRLQEGAINIVALESAFGMHPEVLKEQVERLMESYPAMSAPVVAAELLGTATYDTRQLLGKKTCFTSSPFTLQALPAGN